MKKRKILRPAIKVPVWGLLAFSLILFSVAGYLSSEVENLHKDYAILSHKLSSDDIQLEDLKIELNSVKKRKDLYKDTTLRVYWELQTDEETINREIEKIKERPEREKRREAQKDYFRKRQIVLLCLITGVLCLFGFTAILFYSYGVYTCREKMSS